MCQPEDNWKSMRRLSEEEETILFQNYDTQLLQYRSVREKTPSFIIQISEGLSA